MKDAVSVRELCDSHHVLVSEDKVWLAFWRLLVRSVAVQP